MKVSPGSGASNSKSNSNDTPPQTAPYPISGPDPSALTPIPLPPSSIPVPTQHRDNQQRRHTKHALGALRRLGLSPDQLRGVPRISHLLDQAEGGLPTVLSALRSCDDPDAQKFLDRYDAVSDSDHQWVTLEAIALAAAVAPKRLLELAVSALVEDSRSAGAIVAATYHPRVIAATAKYALEWDGEADRKLFLSGTGFTPRPVNISGGVFAAIQNNFQVPGVGEGDGTDTPADPNALFQNAEDDLRTLHETLDGAKLLQAPKQVVDASAITIGHQYVEEEELECVPRVQGKDKGK